MGKRIDSPRVSVVIPTYNRANELRRCLDSLKQQTIHDFEVLICDDGSTDETEVVATAYSPYLDITYDYAGNFGGPARPSNRGIQLARAPYVAFLDSDDWWTESKLERSLDRLDAGADVVFHDLWNIRDIDPDAPRTLIRADQPASPIHETLLCSSTVIPHSSVVVRTKLIRAIGGICEDKELIAVEDFDALIRLSRVTEKFERIPGCFGFCWRGGGNISEASPEQISRIRAVYARHISSLSDSGRKRAEALLAYRVGRIAQLHGDWSIAVQNLMSAIRGRLNAKYKMKALWLLSFCRLWQRLHSASFFR